MREVVCLVNRDSRGPVTRIEDNVRGAACRIERKDSLDLHMQIRHREGCEHDGDYLLSVNFVNKRSFSKRDGVLIW